jgi:hypothetical protein
MRHAGGALAGALVFVVTLVFVLTGCGPGSSGSSGSAGGQVTSVQQQARTVWLDYARCVRSHGFPDFPDPQVDSQGQAHTTNSTRIKTIARQVQGACGSILSRLPARAQNQPVTATQLRAERLFAECMRRHGLPDWPDPWPDGTFQLDGTPYANMGKTGPVLAGLQACRQYETFGGIRPAGS